MVVAWRVGVKVVRAGLSTPATLDQRAKLAAAVQLHLQHGL